MREKLQGQVWDKEKAHAYMARVGVVRGVNFVPSYCHSYIEMWQHYDEEVIRREVGYTKRIGINSFRIFVATCQWETRRDLVYKNLNRFLALLRESGITVMLTLQPNLYMKPGAILAPEEDPFILHFHPGQHDKGWHYKDTVGTMEFWKEKKETIGAFIRDIVTEYGQDERVTFWDLYNEPWPEYRDMLEHVFLSAREAHPRQPLSSCWMAHDISDITTFHCYEKPAAPARVQDGGWSLLSFEEELAKAKATGRPVLCTECMARTFGNELAAFLPAYRENHIGFYVWGLCAGSAQYHFPWNWPLGSPEPKRWFHCLLYPDGTAYDESELRLIREFDF